MQDAESWLIPCLHEATQAENGVIQAALLQILLSAGLHLHKRNLRVLVTVVDGEEHVPLNAHGLHNDDTLACMHSLLVAFWALAISYQWSCVQVKR